MFEGSLVESRGLVGTGTERWTALGSLTVQLAVAGLLLAIPLLRPQVLTVTPAAAPLVAPFLRRPPAPVEARAAGSSAAMSAPAARPVAIALGPSIWPHPGVVADGPAVAIDTSTGMGPATGSGAGALSIGSGAGPTVALARPKETGPVNISTGVSEGMLLAPIRPVYPEIAQAARLQGTVVIEAVISKVGRVESAHAVSGPQMLQKAALDAVAAARYRPYLLNGQPTEVRTTFTVVFSLGS